MTPWTQKSALIQLRTSLLKFDDLAEIFERSSVFFNENDQTLNGSFSSVSKPIFVTKYVLIFQHFSRSTRLPHLCTAPVLIFALFCKFSLNFPDFCKILRICQQIEHFSPQISRNFAGIAGNDGELLEVCEFCRKMQKFSRGIWEFECMGKKEFEIKFREKGKGIYSRLNQQARIHKSPRPPACEATEVHALLYVVGRQPIFSFSAARSRLYRPQTLQENTHFKL